MPVLHMVAILSTSSAHAAATMALVDGMAGMMFFTTPCVWLSVTPVMPNCVARAAATSSTHFMCSGSSASNDSPGRSAPHAIRCAYSMQCAAVRGVSASVHSGNLVCGGNSHIVHWKHGVKPGRITRACPCAQCGGATAQRGATADTASATQGAP